MTRIRFRRFFVVSTMIVIGGLIAFLWMHRSHSQSLSNSAFAAGNERHPVTPNDSLVKVDVVKPHAGGMERTCILPGSIHAYEAAELFAKVPGYLKIQNVDIGDRVTAGQLLAQLDSPELRRDVDRGKAAVERAEAQVGQMKARILAAEADLNAAKTGIARAEASVKRDIAAFDFGGFFGEKDRLVFGDVDGEIVLEVFDLFGDVGFGHSFGQGGDEAGCIDRGAHVVAGRTERFDFIGNHLERPFPGREVILDFPPTEDSALKTETAGKAGFPVFSPFFSRSSKLTFPIFPMA